MSAGQSPIDTFLSEAAEILESLEGHLLELEAAPDDSERIGAVFRNLRTLKGSGEMFGFSALAHFVHRFENAYDAVRAGRARVTPGLIDVSLRARDHIARLIEIGTDPVENARIERAPEARTLVEAIDACLGAPGGAGDSSSPAGRATPGQPAGAGPRRYELTFAPGLDALRNGMRPAMLFDELAMLGQTEIACFTDEVPCLDELDPTACHLAWKIRLTTDRGRAAIEDVFIFADDGAVTIGDAGPAEGTDGGAGAAGVPAATTQMRTIPSASAAPDPDGRGAGAGAARTESVRVQSFRLDQLMDQLGELVIAQARLNRIADQMREPGLTGVAEEIERLVTGLRDATLSIRMLPIGMVFARFRRLVRDLSGELGKDVQLVTEGGQTELDKNVIDSLGEPLVHLIRNSVDHGIETVERRRAAGKPEQATVRIVAEQLGGEVLVRITDDGAGLDAAAIRARAIERGLIAPDADIAPEALYQLIFEPGFSTARTVSNLSGRGVGMDAVRAVIGELRGTVEVHSVPGRGTTVTLRLPLTLAIIDSLLVRVGKGVFVLPLPSVMECVELPAAEAGRESGRSILKIRDQLVPFVEVGHLFGFETDPAREARIVIIAAEGKRVGLVVDDIIGQHQTVIKSLSAYHRDIAGLAGATILGDGSVALILDPPALVKSNPPISLEAAW
ncbi:chemotaxis protein CheA [Limibaculum sp. FT325]|uniref:chemotaxis protein CheA n=1 Tax=Thermohalobaculum sediminis TaxID=2939436 RepID=UPI0020C0FCB2|nr:chemotaxis protein CheA [Limibaculum sediminis]MCL5776521.1 chemotaxis protein CheA [Limibaculum sediminis]